MVPTVELMFTFRFNSTLMAEFTALMLINELMFCCAFPLRLIDPTVVFVVVLFGA